MGDNGIHSSRETSSIGDVDRLSPTVRAPRLLVPTVSDSEEYSESFSDLRADFDRSGSGELYLPSAPVEIDVIGEDNACDFPARWKDNLK